MENKIRNKKEKTRQEKKKKKRRWGWVPLAIKRCEAIKSGTCVCWDLLGRGMFFSIADNTI